MRKNLIIVVQSYPFDSGEPYLEDELKIIENEFDKIFIVLPESHLLKDIKVPNHPLPKNLTKIIFLRVKFGLIQKIKSLFLIFKAKSISEIKTIKSVYDLPLTFLKLKVLLSYYQKGKDFKNEIQKLIKNEELNIHETIVYSYWSNEFSLGLALLKYDLPKIKCYSRMHGGDLYFYRNNEEYLPWRSFLINTLDNVFVISENGKNYINEKLKNQDLNDKLIVSKLGTQNEKLIDKNNINAVINILSLCFLIELKKIERIIDALSEIETEKINWTHIGSGNSKYESFIKDYAKLKLSNKSNVSFEFVPSLQKKEIAELISKKEIHLLINTSKYEGIPVSMMEALSMGIPIVGMNVGAVSEVLVNDVSGKLLPSKSTPKEIANAIIGYNKLSSEEFKIERLKARRFWEENYMATKNYSAFVQKLKAD